jgi:DNA primase
MAEVYTKPEPPTTAASEAPERRGVSRRSVIEEAKARVETIALADLLCGPGRMQRVGDKWVARCPLPDHEDKSPSFTVYPGDRGWFCYGCLRGGDVIELARFAWGYEKAEVAMAAAQLLQEFGHPIPERPRSWYAKQERQRPVRDAIEEAKIGHYQRRLFRSFLPLVEGISDDAEKLAEVEYLWGAAREIAVLAHAGRSS